MKTEVLPSRNSLWEVNNYLMIPAVHALLRVEYAGFRIDTKKLSELDVLYKKKLYSIESRIKAYSEVKEIEQQTGTTFNINSSDQIRELLFNKLGIDSNSLPKTPTGKISVNKKSRELISVDNDIIKLLNMYTKYGTLYKMFIKPMPKFVTYDGRIHSSYSLNGTVTGRLSGRSPNLQQIPRNIGSGEISFEFDDRLNIKHMFIPSQDSTILQSDYSQMELKIVAEYAEDTTMIEAFKQGKDIHLSTGEKLAGTTIDKDSFWRKLAKTINFGIIYGKTAESLAKDLDIPVKDSERFMSVFFSEMPGVKKFIDYAHKYVITHGNISSMFGRIRRLAMAKSQDKWKRLEAERRAVNTPIQSTASDYTLCSIINLVNTFEKYRMKSKVIATVHDSIIFDINNSELVEAKEIIKQVMSSPQNPLIYWNMKVPITVDIELGSSWGTMEKEK